MTIEFPKLIDCRGITYCIEITEHVSFNELGVMVKFFFGRPFFLTNLFSL